MANFNPRSFGEDQKSFLAHEATIRIRKALKKKRQPHSVPAMLFARETQRVLVQTTDKHARCFVIAMWQKASLGLFAKR